MSAPLKLPVGEACDVTSHMQIPLAPVPRFVLPESIKVTYSDWLAQTHIGYVSVDGHMDDL